MKPNNLQRGVLLSLCGALLAAAYLIPYKAASQTVSASELTLAMLLSAAVLNIIPAWAEHHKRRRSINRLTLGVAFILGGISIVGNYAMAKALLTLSPGIASVLLRSQVMFVGVLGWFWLGERFSARFSIGVLLAFAGLVLLKIDPTKGSALQTEGLFWIFLAAISFAVMQVVTRRVIHRIDPVSVNAMRLWIAVLLLFVLTFQSSPFANLGSMDWLLAALAAFFGPFLSRICIMWSLQTIPAALSALLAMSSPVFAFLLGIVFFRDWPTPMEIFGGSLMLAGISIPVTELIFPRKRTSQQPHRK